MLQACKYLPYLQYLQRKKRKGKSKVKWALKGDSGNIWCDV